MCNIQRKTIFKIRCSGDFCAKFENMSSFNRSLNRGNFILDDVIELEFVESDLFVGFLDLAFWFKNLTSLIINDCLLYGEVFQNLGQFNRLKNIEIKKCSFYNKKQILHIFKITDLESLSIIHSVLLQSSLYEIGQLVKIKKLVLITRHSLHYKEYQHIFRLKSLVKLELYSNSVSENGFLNIGNLTNLEYLKLSGYQYIGEYNYKCIYNHPNIKTLHLHNCFVSIHDLKGIKSLKTLTSLYITGHTYLHRIKQSKIVSILPELEFYSINGASDQISRGFD